MLDAFISENRDAIIAAARARVARRSCPVPNELELQHGVPVFLTQLGEALRLAKASGVVDHDAIVETSLRHGDALLGLGLTIAQVVHDYGDVCQAITELAMTQEAQISTEDFRTLNLCLDDAIAGAVTEYSRQRERRIENTSTERLGVLAHELRNLLNIATLSFESIQAGHVAVNGSTGAMHARSLLRLRDLVDRSLAAVRLDVGIEHFEDISVCELLEEIEIGALILAKARGIAFAVTSVEASVKIAADRQIIAAALMNLLQNAFKFSRKEGSVALRTRVANDRVFFDIEDECGGLPPGKAQELFEPFQQRGDDRSGAGLGLSISAKGAKANGGDLHVRDLPGKGCVFTLDLPRTLAVAG